MSAPLEPHETERLRALEQSVREGLRDFRRTGQALSEIRDNEFFRPAHETFGAYLQDRWNLTSPQAERLIEAAAVAQVLEPLGIEPKSEVQARSFRAAAKLVTELEPEQQRVVARLVEGLVDGTAPRDPQSPDAEDSVPWETPPAAEVRIMASVVKKLGADTTVYHPDSGDEVPFDSLSPGERFEVIRTHVDQKTQAYRDKQEAKASAPPPDNINWADWCLNHTGQSLGPGQRLEIVVEPVGGAPRVVARIVDSSTGEVLAEGPAAVTLKKAVLSLAAQLRG